MMGASRRLRPGDEIQIPDNDGGPDRDVEIVRSIAFAEVFEVKSWNRLTGVLEHGVIAARTGRDTVWTVREFAP